MHWFRTVALLIVAAIDCGAARERAPSREGFCCVKIEKKKKIDGKSIPELLKISGAYTTNEVSYNTFYGHAELAKSNIDDK